MTETPTDPWAWLLGKTGDGSWRMSGSRSSPSANPKVLLLRRAIPHPKAVLAKLVETIKESDPNDRLRWICHRSSRGERRYWLLFLLTQEQKTTQIQYLFGIEFVSQKELGLWFFSGFQEPNHLGQAFLEFYEDDKNNALPRFSLDGTEDLPLKEWLPLALKEELTFRWGFEESKNFPHQTPKQRVDHSQSVKKEVSPKDSTRALTATTVTPPVQEEDGKSINEVNGAVDTSSIRDESKLVSKAIEQTEIEPVSKHQLQLIVCERGAPRLVVLRDKRNTLGRHPLCHVVSPTPSVSARHAIVELNKEGAQIFDLGSQNGTFLNGFPVLPQSPTPLPELALIRLGSLTIVSRITDRTEEEDDDQNYLTELVSTGRLSLSSLQHSVDIAKKQGISTGEQLVLEGLVEPEEWVRYKLGSEAFPPDYLGRTLSVSALSFIAVTLWSWWYFVGF